MRKSVVPHISFDSIRTQTSDSQVPTYNGQLTINVWNDIMWNVISFCYFKSV